MQLHSVTPGAANTTPLFRPAAHRGRRRHPIVPRPSLDESLAWSGVFQARRLLAAAATAQHPHGLRLATAHAALRSLARHPHPAIAEAALRTLRRHGLSLHPWETWA